MEQHIDEGRKTQQGVGGNAISKWKKEIEVQRQMESWRRKKVELGERSEGIYTPDNSLISQAGKFQPLANQEMNLYLGAVR